ncbi:MAG: N-acetylmuramoyl-L-alanine amidase [Anaerocolumna aminovalerica]|uniref:N-acetylmuramoyl-L-alanine amidase family protein n=1 Tax=Anaerocolumna aminovalerica TaxID=1527 RepID=UPI00290D6BB0|nr:N-acetylmuramoyl-L-alanine amidase [Anaerocolumna aminovalerica]MDU6263697.1 N-acetylmuramoyl-L-alanine amidase [Anaerocolumna aminovalerica]
MSKYLIAVDSGHGMETAGKRTPPLPEPWFNIKKGDVIHEKEFNKPTAEYLIDALNRCGFDTINVSPGTTDIPLKDRYTTANNAKADIFVSKHYNAKDGVWGNPDDKKGVPNGIETIISQNASDKSKKLAELVQAELVKTHNRKDRGVKTDIQQSGINIAVLRYTNMPAILTESGFMDNLYEARTMLDPEFQKADAEATCRGICKYFGVAYIPEKEDYIPTAPIDQKSINKDIKWLQEKLNKANKDYQIPITGVFDQKTRISLLMFADNKGWNWDNTWGFTARQATINSLAKVK